MTDDAKVYTLLNLTRNTIDLETTSPSIFGATFFSGNPYLPQPLQDQLTATGTSQFTVNRLLLDAGYIRSHEKLEGYNWVTGVRAKLGRFSLDASYQTAKNVMTADSTGNVDAARFAAARDAVRDSNGNIVCRPTLDADPAVRSRYADCVPLNFFGTGAANPAALDYITSGTSSYRATNRYDGVNLSLSGDLFSLWAGPVSFAIGGEHRVQSLNVTSNSDPAAPVDITGLRGIAATTGRFITNNTGVGGGKFTVNEVFGEIGIPILKNQRFFESLDLNGAVRLTDYSTSGTVTTWKVGGTWEPIDGLRFRATRSRDIRAPTLWDLFQGEQQQFINFFDVHTNISSLIPQVGSGNAALKPEIGDTTSVGVIFQPRFLPDFSLSVDYFNVRVRNAIQQISPIVANQECEASGGAAPSCALIIRPGPFSDRSPGNFPTSVRTAPANIAGLWTRGFDVEANYRARFGEDTLTARLAATYVDSFRTKASSTQPTIEYAGWTENDGLAKLRASLSLNYQHEKLSVFVQERMIGSLKRGPVDQWAEPKLPATFYTDVNLGYDIADKTEAFFNVQNLFGQDPRYIGAGNTPGLIVPTLPGVYDLVGRTYTAGVRFNF
ncbi:TonB-dependent receptor domain-containing protein [Novosphingobium aquimarinum]|uniref:TonB-dependent receptor domain-containing protein n=1 Tax=Novosphingobium aquimarinum TaxID=2682494 RepID=UPI0012EB8D06|nr:TonB-dependent receptor [Novosphingobium aquimarinum]